MSTVIELPDTSGLYSQLSKHPRSHASTRIAIDGLAGALARTVYGLAADGEPCGHSPRILAVVILRGGALLYPGFAREFPNADFMMIALRRVGRTVRCSYQSDIPHGRYRHIVYLDCVAATGNTLSTARSALGSACGASSEIAAVICSSATATDRLSAEGMLVVGYSLRESLNQNLVTPDLGDLDAGDLFSTGLKSRSAVLGDLGATEN